MEKENSSMTEKAENMTRRKRERQAENEKREEITNIKNRKKNFTSVSEPETEFLHLQVLTPQIEIEKIKNCKFHWDKIEKENIREILISNKEFIFGNYNRFYYKRYLEALKDPRISIFKTEWFKDKNCLDIGCNDGTITIMIAICYQPKLIEGIDIDYRLITKAIKNMKYVTRNDLSKKYLNELIEKKELRNVNNEYNYDKSTASDNIGTIINKLNSLPKSFIISLGYPVNSNILDKKEKLFSFKNECNEKFPENIFFSQENYVSEIKDKEKYDTILCLSVVKWIHLNYGDIGVKILFYNIYRQLHIGGILILEPQCWKSYKKRKNLTPEIKEKFDDIKLKPEMFREYLEKTYCFECIMVVNPPSNTKKGFDRPILIFRKIK